MKRFLILSISLLLILSSAFGCASPSTESESKKSLEPTSFSATNVKLVDKGASDYKIVVPASVTPEQRYAAEELQLFIQKSTGCTLNIITDAGLVADENSKFLSVGRTSLLEKQDSIVLDEEFYGQTGVSIDTIGNSVYMSGAKDLGTLYSVYKFLHYQIGFTAYAVDCVKYNFYDTLPLLDFDYHYAPSIEYFMNSEFEQLKNPLDNLRMFCLGKYGLGGGGSIYGKLFDEWSHTCSIIVNPEYYKNDHPEWFLGDQFCFSNDEFAEQMAKNIYEKYSLNTCPYIMIGGADTVGACPCDECKKQGFIYGGHPGLMVRFMNKIAAKLEDYFEEYNIDKEYMLVGLNYHSYMTAPVEKDENGNLTAIHPECVPDNEGKVKVGIFYAPISACWSHALEDTSCETNISFGENLRNWDFLTDNLMVWDYDANFANPTLIMDSWSVFEQQYTSYFNAGVKYVMSQGRGSQEITLGELRTFIKSRLAWDHTLSVDDLIEEFMDAYYGVAAEEMTEYLNTLRSHYQMIYKIQGSDHLSCFHDIKKESFWPHETILNHSRMLASAINKVRNSDCTEQDKIAYEERIYDEYLLTRVNEYQFYATDLMPEQLEELKKLVAYADSIMTKKGYENLR